MIPFIEKTIQQRRHTPGFTLVELLTVIAIIAVLAAITLPIIRTARVSAYTASDLARLRAIGAGMALFVADNNGRFPSKGTSGQNQRETRWMSHVGRYMGIGKDVAITVNPSGTEYTYLVLHNAYRRAEFHSAFTPPEAYDPVAPLQESVGIFGINTLIATNAADSYGGRYGISASDVMLPAKTVLLAERYAGVLGDAATVTPVPAGNLDNSGSFPKVGNGMASNAEIMRRGTRLSEGPVSLLMADYSVIQVNLEDLDFPAMNSKTTNGIRFQPTVQ